MLKPATTQQTALASARTSKPTSRLRRHRRFQLNLNQARVFPPLLPDVKLALPRTLAVAMPHLALFPVNLRIVVIVVLLLHILTLSTKGVLRQARVISSIITHRIIPLLPRALRGMSVINTDRIFP